jgi:predicted transcriptional regulator
MKLRDYLTSIENDNITPRDFAEQCGIGISTLFKYLAGTSHPRLDKAIKISKLTGGKVSVDELRGRTKK